MPLSFKGFAQFSALTSLPTGSVVSFENDGNTLLGQILDYQKPKYTLIDQNGQKRELVPERLHKLPAAKELEGLNSDAQRIAALELLIKRAQEKVSTIDLEKLWHDCPQKNSEFDNSALSKLCFGKDELVEHLALRIALSADRIFFQRKKDRFLARDSENIQELRKAEADKKQKKLAEEQLIEFLLKKLEGQNTEVMPECAYQIEMLEALAVDASHIDNNQKREAKDLLTRLCEKASLNLHGSIHERAWQVLERAGWFNASTNPTLLRERPRQNFSQAALKEAENLDIQLQLKEQAQKTKRVDLSSIWCVSIDDPSTKDVDDAISLEQTESGFELGIHITDLGSFLRPGSALEAEAKLRATSIYCPDITINMLPELLCEEKLSLKQGALRPCMSFLFEVSPSSRILNSKIVLSTVQVKERISYEQVDELLESGHAQFSRIYEIAMGLEAERFKSGGFRVNKREVGVTVKSDGNFSIYDLDEAAPSRAMIAELMVLANRCMAEFAEANRIPIVFRGQRQPDPNSERLESIPEGPARDYAARARLQRSITAIEPVPHATLGLKSYAQATSPLRRYLDLCNQWQIIAFMLEGKPFFSAEELRKLIFEVEEPLKRATNITRECKRYWLIKYLSTQGTNISGTVIRCDKSSPMVELDKIYIPAIARTDRKVKLGEELKLKIASIDARYDLLKLEEVTS